MRQTGGGSGTPGPQRAAEGGFWERLWRRPTRRWLLGIPVGGFAMFAIGVAALVSFNGVLHATNTEAFCANSCHEMRDFIYPEFIEHGQHASTRTGVHATCPDCHVPKAFGPKMLRKMQATKREVWHWIIGTIDTREKFEARRALLAQDVWDVMKATDSRECRGCHDVARMDFAEQSRYAARRHQRAAERGETCIDCHRGVAHLLPPELEEAPKEEES